MTSLSTAQLYLAQFSLTCAQRFTWPIIPYISLIQWIHELSDGIAVQSDTGELIMYRCNTGPTLNQHCLNVLCLL